jgi:rod shape-determining protein MreB
MTGKCLGFDIGSVNMRIFTKSGIIYSEPSCAAVDKSSGKFVAFGRKAYNMIGREPNSVEIKFPFRAGVESEIELTIEIIKRFIDNVCSGSIFKPNIIATVPYYMSGLEKKTILDAIFLSGAKRACLVPKSFASAIGAGINFKKADGIMISEIGGGMIETSVLTMKEIAYSSYSRIGSDDINFEIIRSLRKDRNIEIGYLTAENIKQKIGSAIRRGEEIALIESGKNSITGVPINFEVTSSEIYLIVKNKIDEIASTIIECFEKTPPELTDDVSRNGIILSGSGAKLNGLSDYIQRETGINVTIAKNCGNCCALGAMKSIKNINSLKKTSIGFKYLNEF